MNLSRITMIAKSFPVEKLHMIDHRKIFELKDLFLRE